MAPCVASWFGYSTYVTTGRPSLPTAVDASKTPFGARVWLTPLPVAEVPSDCQKGLTPASASVAVVRTVRTSSERRRSDSGFTGGRSSKRHARPEELVTHRSDF